LCVFAHLLSIYYIIQWLIILISYPYEIEKKKRSSITPEKSSSNKEKRVITIVLCEKNLETGNISLKDLKVLYNNILTANVQKHTNLLINDISQIINLFTEV
jgi:hypothetical protein